MPTASGAGEKTASAGVEGKARGNDVRPGNERPARPGVGGAKATAGARPKGASVEGAASIVEGGAQGVAEAGGDSRVEGVTAAARGTTGAERVPGGASAPGSSDGGGAAWEIRHLLIASIVRSPYQPRREFDEASIVRLEESIRQTGLMQPIIVRPGRAAGTWELVAGERRWRAANSAGLVYIPAVVRELTDEQSAEWGLIENVQREDLNPMERAGAFKMLQDRFGLTQAQVAQRVGVDRTTVTNVSRLLELEEPVRQMISAGTLSGGHGRALLAAPPGAARVALARRAAEESWSVRQLERATASLSRGEAAAPATPASAEAEARAASREALAKGLGAHLGTKVRIVTDRTGKRGHLVVEFYGLDHFDGLLAKMGYGG